MAPKWLYSLSTSTSKPSVQSVGFPPLHEDELISSVVAAKSTRSPRNKRRKFAFLSVATEAAMRCTVRLFLDDDDEGLHESRPYYYELQLLHPQPIVLGELVEPTRSCRYH
eukprot:SAG31_NODE_2798_length_5081_cov_5.160779_1_plen_111_part_00